MFKVSGIPTLVFLDANTGKVITTDGRSVVMEDEHGDDFPWQPKPLYELVKGKLINNEGEEKDFDADVKGTVFGLYFSAHWVCGSCVCSEVESCHCVEAFGLASHQPGRSKVWASYVP